MKGMDVGKMLQQVQQMQAEMAKAQEELAKEYSVKRLSGDDRYGTAAAIIDNGGKAGDTALLATGTNFPDALGGGPVAYAEDMPLAITKPGDMPNDVLASLKSAGVSKVLVLGGESAVGGQVLVTLVVPATEAARIAAYSTQNRVAVIETAPPDAVSPDGGSEGQG